MPGTGAFERAYIVCSTQRSGGTLLCELLESTGVAGRPKEFFEAVALTGVPPHPGDYLAGLPRTGAGIRDDGTPPEAPPYSDLRGLASYRDHLARSFATGTTPNGVFATKLMFRQLIEVEKLARSLDEHRELDGADLLNAMLRGTAAGHEVPVYVWHRRYDKVRQAISLWRALQTRAWRAEREAGGESPEQAQRARPAPGELRYSFEGIDHLVYALSADDRGWNRFFQSNRISPLVVSYEDDLERDQLATVTRVLAAIGVTVPPDWHPRDSMARQADSLNDEWAAAYLARADPPRDD
jgi:LPS sulfotransferase NodH